MKKNKIFILLIIVLLAAYAGRFSSYAKTADAAVGNVVRKENLNVPVPGEMLQSIGNDVMQLKTNNKFAKMGMSVRAITIISITTSSVILADNIFLIIPLIIKCRKYKRILKEKQEKESLASVTLVPGFTVKNRASSEKISSSYPTLVRVKTGETIVIDKDNFLIGSDVNFADYCIRDNHNIERQHACIIKTNSIYYLKDLDTENGTYINGMRIAKDYEVRVYIGNTIGFADEVFELK